MITKEKLDEWRQAKVLAVANPNTDPEVMIAFQEMFIAAKQLRLDNLKLLNAQEVMEKMAEYIRHSHDEHYLDSRLEDLYEEILELCAQSRINLPELCND